MYALILSIISTMMIIPQKEILYFEIQEVAKVYEYVEQKKQYSVMTKNLITELNKKYGDGDFEIVSVEDDSGYRADVVVKSSYIKENFGVNARYNGTILDDDFIEVYAKEKWNIEDIRDYVIKKEQSKIPKEYDIKFNYESTTIKGSYDYQKGRVPVIEDLIEMVNVRVENDVIVGNSYTNNDLDKFSKNICDVCRIYIENYARDEFDSKIWFKFENGINPYQNPEQDKLGAYKAGGYVADAGPYWYMLYLNPSPLHIKK